MLPREWFRPPRHLAVTFFLITFLLTVAFGWLSWQLLEKDRALSRQRLQERRENVADLATAALQRHLTQIEEQLTGFTVTPGASLTQEALESAKELPSDSLLVMFHAGGVETAPSGRLLYYPYQRAAREPPAKLFHPADVLEFRQRDIPKAIEEAGKLSKSQDPVVRAAALVRLGRNLRKAGRFEEALATYEALARLGSVAAGGLPAELVAREARCAVLEKLADHRRVQQEASELHRDLHSGRWQLGRAAYTFYAEEIRRWVPQAPQPPAGQLGLAAAVESLWDEWQKPDGATKGRRSFRAGEEPFLLVWRRSEGRMAAMAAGPGYLESRWWPELEPVPENQGVGIALADASGRAVFGRLEGKIEEHSLRLASATQLPWTLHAMSAETVPGLDGFPARRQLLIGGLLVIALLILAGSYFIGRAVARELAVARLQSDFVSAVSHEFRTPLTSLRQLSELLVKDRVPDEKVRRQYYQAMERESRRLYRLVEGLLNFGRMEAGVLKYRFEPIDPAELLRGVVEEFQQEAGALGYRVALNTNGVPAPVRGDREALGCVIWNLLDNAVKYSPDCLDVWVDLEQEGRRVAIHVRDRGVGIPAGEHRQIFQKFVRGAAAKTQSVQGTGIGLAVTRQILSAHGGEITIDSQPGVGSTFTVFLPAVE